MNAHTEVPANAALIDAASRGSFSAAITVASEAEHGTGERLAHTQKPSYQPMRPNIANKVRNFVGLNYTKGSLINSVEIASRMGLRQSHLGAVSSALSSAAVTQHLEVVRKIKSERTGNIRNEYLVVDPNIPLTRWPGSNGRPKGAVGTSDNKKLGELAEVVSVSQHTDEAGREVAREPEAITSEASEGVERTQAFKAVKRVVSAFDKETIEECRGLVDHMKRYFNQSMGIFERRIDKMEFATREGILGSITPEERASILGRMTQEERIQQISHWMLNPITSKSA